MAKRSNGEGEIFKYRFDEKGNCKMWSARIMIGYNEKGKPIRKQFYGKTQKEVKEKLDKFKHENALNKTNIDYDKLTVEEYYYNWLISRKNDYKPTSFKNYYSIYKNYIKGSLVGKTPIKKLTSTVIKSYYNSLIGSVQSTHTIRKINTMLKTCLNSAVKDEIIIKNPCTIVDLPKVNREKRREVFTIEEQETFLNYIKGHELEPLFLTALSTGMRLAELLGLKWQHVDLDNNIIHVRETRQDTYIFDDELNPSFVSVQQTPKTDNSTRDIPIPEKLTNILRLYKAKQKEHRLQNKGNYRINDYVFKSKMGVPVKYNKPYTVFQNLQRKIGIKPIKFHGLRKTYATRLFENGVPPKTVQVLMGHTDIETTLNIYTEVMEDEKIKAVDKLNDIFNF